MELTIALAISIISVVMTILNFAFGRKDKSNKDVGQEAYNQGKLDQTLANIMDKLEKIEKKLDFYDKEIDERIKVALDFHIREYHKGV